MKGGIEHYDGVLDYRGNAAEACHCGAASTMMRYLEKPTPEECQIFYRQGV